ncbi:hypothetical protein JG688_00018383 [Phytophthora aleatoria]|uniref:Tc1-like transposase DDE domain-containing protein n=2 Tax=Phytophthora TaxID=4783 RepID=A0A8J5LXR1_9STRA|nr:hypothetical protein JG688_00018383 [Phytophthora aleatoria]
MAKDKGHEVVYTPPYHSDLQPIELVWTIVKGKVGQQYSTTTTFADILPRLETEFENLKPKSVQGCINAANKQLMQLKKHLEAMDNCDESSSEGELSGVEEENENSESE